MAINKHHQRWRVPIGTAFANFMTFGAMFSFGVFLTPLAEEFGTSTGPIATLFSATVCLYYIGGAVGGRLGDRHGARPVVLVSAILLISGLVLTAIAQQLWFAFFSFGMLVGLSVGFCYTSSISLVSRSFTKHRAFALGVLLAGVGTGTLVVPVVSEALIDAYSWRTAYVCLAAVALPATVWAVLVSDRTGGKRNRAGAGATNASATNAGAGKAKLISFTSLARDRRFRRYYLAVTLLGPGFYAPILFYNDYAIDRGIASQLAALLVGISGASSVIGRLAYGLGERHMTAMNLCRMGYALLLMALVVWLTAGWFAGGATYPVLVASAFMHGLGWALLATATPTVLTEWLGLESLGGSIGIYYTGLGVGALAGPAAGGFIIDRSGFTPAIALALATTLVALLILFMISSTAVESRTSRHQNE